MYFWLFEILQGSGGSLEPLGKECWFVRPETYTNKIITF